MILYKNVDVCELESIVKNGILSIDETWNNNWDEGKRASNRTDVVYLFKPDKCVTNSFPQYGVALLEVDCYATENTILDDDANVNLYTEYITKKILPSEIKRIIIPEMFKPYIELPEEINVTWCKLKANYYKEECNNGEYVLEKVQVPKEILEQFAKPAPLMDSTNFNFFRGITEKRTMIDLYNIKYVF